MELDAGKVTEKESEGLTVDFSKQALKRIERASNDHQNAVALVLDHNEIQKLDNLEYYPNLTKLSVVNNQLVRMYGVSYLVNLVTLDLSNNSLVTIEGLKDLKELKHLNLAKNRIKAIEHLNKNLELEKLDLSENNIMYISDVSYLTKLKEFYLHGNRISHLKQCEKYLPNKIEILTLNNNSIADLNEISYLVQLTSLKELSIVNNPCLDFTEDQKFNYRPFVKNWCSSLSVLDNSPLNDIECLKAEWLYSQGRGRGFRSGEHSALIEYLISVCPREGEEDHETEDVKKLKLILSKAHLHQQQLREQISTGKFTGGETYRSPFKKKIGIAEKMVISFHDSSAREARQIPELMTRSLDSGISKKSSRISKADLNQIPLQTSTTFIPIPDSLISPDVGQPIGGGYPGPSSVSSRTSRSSSRTSPRSTPESKRKPLKTASPGQSDESTSPVNLKKSGKFINSRSSTPLSMGGMGLGKNCSSRKFASIQKKESRSGGSEKNCRETSEEEDSEVLSMRIKTHQMRAPQRRKTESEVGEGKPENSQSFKYSLQKEADEILINSPAWKAAVCIQRLWRGYRARNLNAEVVSGCKNIQINRMQDYIAKVMNDLEAAKNALEGNRKLVVLQMQAINSLWKKMVTLQPGVLNSSDSKVSLENLVKTCETLNKQVEELQNVMKTMQKSSDSVSSIPIATQTDIVAVHTPQDNDDKEKFPYNSTSKPAENQTFIDSTGDVEQNSRESVNDSDNCFSNSTVKIITELFNNPSVSDASNINFASSQCSIQKEVLNECLSKPSKSVQEAEASISKPNELESSQESEKSQNTCNS